MPAPLRALMSAPYSMSNPTTAGLSMRPHTALCSGVFRIAGSLMHRFPHWGWIFFGGVLNLVLGILIWREWPESAFCVIGLFVGIDLVFDGMSWVMTALTVRGATTNAAA